MLKSQIDSVFYVAAAGAGKTKRLVDIAVKHSGRVLLTTYTRQNTEEIINRIAVTGFSENIRILPWYSAISGMPYPEEDIRAPLGRRTIWNRPRQWWPGIPFAQRHRTGVILGFFMEGLIGQSIEARGEDR